MQSSYYLIPIALFAMCGIYYIAFFAFRGRFFRGLRQSLEQYAARHGFQFSAEDQHRLVDADLPLLRRGGKRKCSNVVSGNWHGMPFTAADYRLHEDEADARGRSRGPAHAYKYFAIVVTPLDPRLRLPPTVISRRIVPVTAGDHIGLRPFMAGWEPFDRRFQVEADGRQPPPAVNQPVMRHLLASLADNGPAFRWEVAGSQLLVATFPRNQPTEDMLMEHIEPLLHAARAFADQLATGLRR